MSVTSPEADGSVSPSRKRGRCRSSKAPPPPICPVVVQQAMDPSTPSISSAAAPSSPFISNTPSNSPATAAGPRQSHRLEAISGSRSPSRKRGRCRASDAPPPPPIMPIVGQQAMDPSTQSRSSAAADPPLPSSSSPSTSTTPSNFPATAAGPRRSHRLRLTAISVASPEADCSGSAHPAVHDCAFAPPPTLAPSSPSMNSELGSVAGVEKDPVSGQRAALIFAPEVGDKARDAGSDDRKGKRVVDEVGGDDNGENAVLPDDQEDRGAALMVGRARRRRFSIEEKGKFKLTAEPAPLQVAEQGPGPDGLESEVLHDDQEDHDAVLSIGCARRRRFNVEEKGKAKFAAERAPPQAAAQEPGADRLENANPSDSRWSRLREENKRRARKSASKFALFKEEKKDDEEEEEDEQRDLDGLDEDWPGPFSTAMRIIENRQGKLLERQLNSSKSSEPKEAKINWAPSRGYKVFRPPAPSLVDLSMRVIAENVEEIESLVGIPDMMKRRLVSFLCDSRKMSYRIFNHLVSDSPSEISLPDCSWLKEEEFERGFEGWNTSYLKELQLDLCGHCLSDYALFATLARQENSLPSLTKLSLKGAYRISDDGLKAIASSAPLLSSINLSWCPSITAVGITHVTEKLYHVLRELHIDNCQGIDAMGILPTWRKVRNLEVLSISGIQTVSREFVNILTLDCGKTLRKLNLANCLELKSSAMKSIADNCPQLCALDLRDVTSLNDPALKHLANGCRSIHNLKFRRNTFSDEAIAAFLEASGSKLLELSLNHVQKAAHNTALAISQRCLNLRSLDLSFCRMITDEGFGLIADSCRSLEVLKLFGCTQVTNTFLEGHSNELVKVIGHKGPVLTSLTNYNASQ